MDYYDIKRFDKDDTLVVKGWAIGCMLIHHLFAYPDKIAIDF